MDMVNADVNDSDIDTLTQDIMQHHGFQHKAYLNLDDFQVVMSQYSGAMNSSFKDEGKFEETKLSNTSVNSIEQNLRD